MSAVVNHEINNLLNYLRASISPLKRDIAFLLGLPGKNLSPEDQKEFENIQTETITLLDNLEKGSGQASEIISEIGHFDKAGKGEKRPVNINSIIESTSKLLFPSFPEIVSIRLDLKATKAVNGLVGPLKQMLINLMKNGI